jgi:hypothetical protein
VVAPAPPGSARWAARLRSAALAIALTAAAAATAVPVVPWATRAGAREAAEPSPLGGQWQTFANGDRIRRVARQGAILWAGTEAGGLVRWDTAARTYRQYLHPQDGLPSNDVFDVEAMPDGSLWLATGGGLVRFDPAAGVRTVLTPDTSPGMPSRRATAIEVTPVGDLWVGFEQDWDPTLPPPETGAVAGAFRPGGLARYSPGAGTWGPAFHATISSTPGMPDHYASIPSENVTDVELTSDGILWVGTRPYLVWEPESCAPGTCTGRGGAWIASGGGLAGNLGDRWTQWLPAEDGGGSCYTSEVTDLAADAQGRAWVATRGRGVLVMRNGIESTACSRQARYERERTGVPGLRGLTVWSVDVDDEGRVWIGHGDGAKTGRGVAILDHNGTLDDWSEPWQGDDLWTFVDFDDVGGKTTAMVNALDVRGPGPHVMAARDDTDGDGFGIRLYDPASRAWTALRTADDGLPSNRVSSIAYDAPRDVTWFAFAARGVARHDGPTGRWDAWRAFENDAVVADVLSTAVEDDRRVRVSLGSKEEYDAAFPGPVRFARFGNDPTFYEVTAYGAQRGGEGPWVYVSPVLAADVRAGAVVYRVVRSVASDDARQIAIGPAGDAWIGGGLTIWRGGAQPGEDCPTFPQCYLDGGLAHWDGTGWTVYNNTNSNLPRNGAGAVQVHAVAIDAGGRVWASTGDGRSVGNGIGVLDPATGKWTVHTYRTGLSAGDGAADFDVDPSTGHVYSAHHPVTGFVTLPNGQIQQYFDGGGVARWNGASWRSWFKPAAAIRAFGDKGILEAVLVDRTNGRIWAGGWDGDPLTFHWLKGKDVDATVNWCPLASCGDGDWEPRVWPDDGTVATLALDSQGQVWVGTNRAGAGLAPPQAGVKLFSGGTWSTVTTYNSHLAGNEITALVRAGERMWVGTIQRGVSRYDPAPPPTPTVTPTATPSPTSPATPTVTEETTPTPDGTPGVTATPTPTPSATVAPSHTPTPSTTPSPTPEPCGPGRRCPIFLPACMKRA